MGITGRKPTPASMIDHKDFKKSIKEIEVRKEAEEKLKTGAELRCPSYVSKEAKKEWKRVMKLYRAMEVDILSDLDTMSLVMYCEATAVYKKAQETWAKYQQVVAANPEAQRVLDKCFLTMEKQTKIISSLSEQLCLTPVGRARMGMIATKSEEPSKLDILLEEDD